MHWEKAPQEVTTQTAQKRISLHTTLSEKRRKILRLVLNRLGDRWWVILTTDGIIVPLLDIKTFIHVGANVENVFFSLSSVWHIFLHWNWLKICLIVKLNLPQLQVNLSLCDKIKEIHTGKMPKLLIYFPLFPFRK